MISGKEPAERVEEAAMKDPNKVTFIANPKQHAFIMSKAKSSLFASRFGEGKSAGLTWAVWHHTRWNPGARWLVVRDTWENLRDTTQKEFFDWFPPGEYGSYVASEKCFTWNVEGVEGEVYFLGMDEERDAQKLLSRAIAGFAMDEPAPAAQSLGISETVFDLALGRMRQKSPKYGTTFDRCGGWYTSKLATNNPDEEHWTYRRFVDPGNPDFDYFQPREPENLHNLPTSYYEDLRRTWAHRPDLVRRFVDGRFGFQQIGVAVTPQWSDPIHLTHSLVPLAGYANYPLIMLWDFGLNPTCVITQIVPSGHWNFLESFVGDEIGVEELIELDVKPALRDRYRRMEWYHIADPAGVARDQTRASNSPYISIRRMLGGSVRPGPIDPQTGIVALNAVLGRLRDGKGLVQVDGKKCGHVHRALRGGWHYNKNSAGVVNPRPQKDHHSHPGDACRYGAAVLFPTGRAKESRPVPPPRTARFFGHRRETPPTLGFGRPGLRLPKELRTIGPRAR